MFEIATYSNRFDNEPKVERLTWAELTAKLLEHRRGEKNGPAWSPVDIEGTRANENVRAITVAVFDLDHVTDAAASEAIGRVQAAGLALVVHSTYSHREPDDCCLRLVVPLSRPVKPAEWPRVRESIVRQFELPADPATKDLSRMYFLPAAPPGAEVLTHSAEGMPIDVDALGRRKLETAPVPGPIDLRAVTDEIRTHASEHRAFVVGCLAGEGLGPKGKDGGNPYGGQDNALQVLMSTVAFCTDAPWEAVEHLFTPCFAATPNDTVEHLSTVAKDKFERARERKAKRDAEEAANARAFREAIGKSAAPPSDLEPRTTIIDPSDPLATSKLYLKSTNDAEGVPALVRWQEEFFRAHTSSTKYEPCSNEAVSSSLYRFTEGTTDLEGKAVKPRRALIENLTHALKAECHLDAKSAPAWIDGTGAVPAEEITAFTNGLLHVPTRTFFQATRRYFGLNAVDFAYDPAASAPAVWFKFLDQLWAGDAESIETLQEIFGLALTSDTSFQKLFLLVGPPRSGKGTIARVLTDLIGPANVCSPTLNGLGHHFGLESLIGKTLAIVSDARLTPKTDVGAVAENLLRISGEDTTSVPRKHRSDWTAKLSARFLIISNELPGFLDQSGALSSRFIVLQLTHSFLGHEDRGLTRRLLAELPGIANWALEGLDRLRARGHFLQPKSAQEAVEQLDALASPIKAFVSERCEVLPGAEVDCGKLFAAWQEWSAGQGRDHTGTLQMFGRNLSAAFPSLKVTRPCVGGDRVRRYEGIRLLPRFGAGRPAPEKAA